MVRYLVINVQVKVIRKVLLVVLNTVDYYPSYTDFLELMTILFSDFSPLAQTPVG